MSQGILNEGTTSLTETAAIGGILNPEFVLTGQPAQDKGSILQALAGAVSGGIPGITVSELLYAVAQRDKSAPVPLGKGLGSSLRGA